MPHIGPEPSNNRDVIDSFIQSQLMIFFRYTNRFKDGSA